MFCVNCGTEAIADFCANCGKPVKAGAGKRKGISGRVKRIMISFCVIFAIYSFVAMKIGSVMP